MRGNFVALELDLDREFSVFRVHNERILPFHVVVSALGNCRNHEFRAFSEGNGKSVCRRFGRNLETSGGNMQFVRFGDRRRGLIAVHESAYAREFEHSVARLFEKTFICDLICKGELLSGFNLEASTALYVEAARRLRERYVFLNHQHWIVEELDSVKTIGRLGIRSSKVSRIGNL